MKHLCLFLLLLLPFTLKAETADSTKTGNQSLQHLLRSACVATPIVAGGLLEKHYDADFRRHQTAYKTGHSDPVGSVAQFVPAAVMYGLKAAGVPSRSSWERMLASDAASVAIMAVAVEGLKHSTDVRRPDGSDTHSFPSGHAAKAFMTATMLSREYGHLSPWVSVGAYAVATGTGLLRVANNKHWISDVMVGAGVGILSTEFGYWIVDALMKDRGLNRTDRLCADDFDDAGNSFVSVYLGFNVPLGSYSIDGKNYYETASGTTLGAEGAWFLNRYIGLGGRLTMSDQLLIVNGEEAPNNTLRFYTAALGPYLSLPLASRWLLGTKALAAYTYYNSTRMGSIEVKSNGGWGFSTGLSLDYRVRQNLRASLFADYNIQPPHSLQSGERLQTLTLGFCAGLSF